MSWSFFEEKLSRWSLIPLRLAAGIIFMAHGAQKLFGVWGGFGFSGTIENFSAGLGIPAGFTVLAMVTEFFGGIALIIGLMTRLASLGLAIVMLTAIFTVHLPWGFFLNWYLTPGVGHGMEMNLALLGGLLVLFFGGAGRLSIDKWWWAKRCQCEVTGQSRRELQDAIPSRESARGIKQEVGKKA